MDSLFQLHPRLEADTIPLADLPLSKVLLMNNRLFHWLILVPRRPEVIEILDLDVADQQELWQEINQVSKLLKVHFPCDKLNIATLGNQVPQLHIHIIARLYTDACWPNPVWGGESEVYEAEESKLLQNRLSHLLIEGN